MTIQTIKPRPTYLWANRPGASYLARLEYPTNHDPNNLFLTAEKTWTEDPNLADASFPTWQAARATAKKHAHSAITTTINPLT